MKEYLKLFQNCQITKGFNRSLLLDLQKNKSFLIPNDLVELIELLELPTSVKDIQAIYGSENKQIIDEYIEFLTDKNILFYCDEENLNNFTKLNLEYLTPSKVTNTVFEIDKFEVEIFEKFIEQIDKLSCNNLTIFSCGVITKNDFKEINNILQESRIISFEMYLEFNIVVLPLIFDKIVNNQCKLTTIYIYNAPFNQKFNFGVLGNYEVVYTINKINSFKYCGVVNMDNFFTHQNNYFESINHNSCLHKKISIDKDGNIKNCPSMTQSFGNIKDTTLEEALIHPDFKKYWNVNKDMIAVCKDCEFRHICTDCRAYTERNHFEGEIDLSKPL